jgi:hypothetical protein
MLGEVERLGRRKKNQFSALRSQLAAMTERVE